MKTKAILISLSGLLLIGALVYVWLVPGSISHAPNIALKTLKGETIQLAGLEGKPVLITFWATNCPGCLKEIPHLVQLYKQLSPKGLEIIGITTPQNRPDHVVAMTEAKQIPYPIALDIDGKASQAFGNVHLTPTSFLIAPDGRIAHQKTGQLDIQKIQALIETMLPAQTTHTGIPG
jgi:peroxiredoxin